ncbi:MAG TPA: methyltransferase domain-containing protein [Nocardioidaceae bacterium]
MSDPLAPVRATWDGHAADYDTEPDHGLGDPTVRSAWRTLLLEHLPPAPARVADLGCGTGSLAVLLAEEGYDVDGVDLSPRMLEVARRKAAAAGVSVPFTEGDASEPGLPVGAFDVVLCRHVLWALPDRPAALSRWVDLLRPGGRLLLVEGSWHTGAGLDARRTTELVREHRSEVTVRHLPEPTLWGGATGDERYLVVSTR